MRRRGHKIKRAECERVWGLGWESDTGRSLAEGGMIVDGEGFGLIWTWIAEFRKTEMTR